MRSRGRYFRKPRRDADSLAPVSSGRYRAVPLPRFRREVVALLVAAAKTGEHGPKLDSTHALRLVIKWDKMLRLRHSQGKPPCNVSDHILKFEKQGVVCPCGSAMSGARDKERGKCHRCVSRGRIRSLRDPSRSSWSRAIAWRNKKLAEKREDFGDITHNVGEVTRAAAQGRMPAMKDLRSVRTPIGGYRMPSRDVQVIIKDSGSSKRQRYNPAKKKRKAKGKFVRKPFGGNFAAKMRAKYGDQGTSMNTQDSARDPESETKAYRQGVRDGKEDARHGEASDILAAWHSHKLVHGDLRAYAKGYIKGSKMTPRQRELEWKRVLMTIRKGPRRSPWGVMKTPGRDPSRRTSRDFSEDVRHLSLTALGRLLRQYHQRGDEAKCHVIEKEIDRRTKGFR